MTSSPKWSRLHPPAFSPSFRAELIDLFAWRRDVRSFRSDPLPDGTLERLISIACLAPSVGLSEPWRFVVVEDPARRQAVRADFERENAAALAAQAQSRQGLYAKLKLAGLSEAPVQIAVFADPSDSQGHDLGRITMPETVDHSVAIAIHTLWLAARVDGIGVGWVSILDPKGLRAVLDVPPDWRLIGYLCLGYPMQEENVPALQRAGWDKRRDPSTRILRR